MVNETFLNLNRNEVRHGEPRKTSSDLVKGIVDLLEEFKIASPRKLTPSTNAEVKWRSPPQGWYKINMDGAMFSYEKVVGMGVTIRDE